MSRIASSTMKGEVSMGLMCSKMLNGQWRWYLRFASSGLIVDHGVADSLEGCREAAGQMGWEAS